MCFIVISFIVIIFIIIIRINYLYYRNEINKIKIKSRHDLDFQINYNELCRNKCYFLEREINRLGNVIDELEKD